MTATIEAPAAPQPPRPPAARHEPAFDHIVHGPAARPPQIREARRALGGIRLGELLAIIGALAAAFATTWLLTTQLLPISGELPFLLLVFGFFIAYYALLLSFDEGRVTVADRVVAVLVHTLAAVVLVALVFVVVFTVGRGIEALAQANFFVEDMSLAGPLDPLEVGGIVHAITGSLIQIGIALLITIPLGIITALFLNEMPSRYARFVRTVVEAMSALPSIVAGLFIYATAILILGIPKSGFAAALAISVMMLPIMIRSADVVIRMVPATLKEGAVGLGAEQWRTVWHVTLPTARSGLTTAIILATARGIGETSPVLLTSGFTAALNVNPFQDPMVSLPLAVFQFVKSPEPTMIARGFGTAAVLMLLVLLLFAAARWLGGRTLDKRARARARRAALIARVRSAVRVGWRATRRGATAARTAATTLRPRLRAAADTAALAARRASDRLSTTLRAPHDRNPS